MPLTNGTNKYIFCNITYDINDFSTRWLDEFEFKTLDDKMVSPHLNDCFVCGRDSFAFMEELDSWVCLDDTCMCKIPSEEIAICEVCQTFEYRSDFKGSDFGDCWEFKHPMDE